MTRAETSRRIVITGGPCSGKSTLVDELAARGFATVPEAAIVVIDELNQSLGIEGQKSWRRNNLTEFQARVVRKQLELEAEALSEPNRRDGLVFFDRGCLDGLAYCQYFEVEPPRELLAAAESRHYDLVFVLATLSDFHFRGDEGRTSNQETSVALGAALEEVYRTHGYQPSRIPVASVADRAEQIIASAAVGGAQL